ncbi:hypothetical protein [Clostridium tunisiense]|uniref:hypothetical protein n=1 Tax=Clostridium tunisiense TaxID=219748 RepID=UPI0002F3271D|nr:hypothetical protein [Clostridium tunisiense]
MNKTLENIINNTIEREYRHINEHFGEPMRKNPELQRELDESVKLREELKQKLLQLLSKEYEYLLEEFETTCGISASVEARIMFKEGLILGLTDLSYLSEVGQEIVLI